MDNERDGKHKEGREEIRERLGENQGEIRIRRDEDNGSHKEEILLYSEKEARISVSPFKFFVYFFQDMDLF